MCSTKQLRRPGVMPDGARLGRNSGRGQSQSEGFMRYGARSVNISTLCPLLRSTPFAVGREFMSRNRKKRKIRLAWKLLPEGRQLAGLISCRGHKTRDCSTIQELTRKACSIFEIQAATAIDAIVKIRAIPKDRIRFLTIEHRAITRPVPFYESDGWRRVRYEALKRHGAKCQCCGARPSAGKPLHVDHIKPRARFPALELQLSNLQVLCKDCNLGKGAWDKTDWRQL